MCRFLCWIATECLEVSQPGQKTKANSLLFPEDSEDCWDPHWSLVMKHQATTTLPEIAAKAGWVGSISVSKEGSSKSFSHDFRLYRHHLHFLVS